MPTQYKMDHIFNYHVIQLHVGHNHTNEYTCTMYVISYNLHVVLHVVTQGIQYVISKHTCMHMDPHTFQ